jgi:hypothetical protein
MIGVNVKAPGASGFGAQVHTTEGGHEVLGIARLSVEFSADDYARAYIEIVSGAVHIDNAVAEFSVAHPVTGEIKPVKRVEYEDGTSWDLSDDAPDASRAGLQVIRYHSIGSTIAKRIAGQTTPPSKV